jgi:subtilisin family serine protease
MIYKFRSLTFFRLLATASFAGFLLIVCVTSPPVHSQVNLAERMESDTKTNLAGQKQQSSANGVSKQDNSRSDDRISQEQQCPRGQCEIQKGRVLIKLAPDQSTPVLNSRGPGPGVPVNSTLAAQGVVSLEPVFPQAERPKADESITTPQGQQIARPDLTRWYRAVLRDNDADVFAAAKALSQSPGVVWAEPDYLRRPAGSQVSYSRPQKGTPNQASRVKALTAFNDPLYGQQWHLAAVNAPQAWDYLESQGLPPGGSHDVIVAVIDTGVDYNHPDLAANIWTNSQEIPGNGIDDDNNGYVDDVHGVNVITNSGNPQDDHGHGTHVAGIIAAQANNNIGGVGVAYNVQIMAIKAAQYSGVLAASDIAEAIYYAASKGADVINMSFGGYARSQVEEDALAVGFSQAVLVAAAGNDATVNLPCFRGRNFYPAAYNYVLGVMARTQTPNSQGDYLAGFSNYDCLPRDTNEYEVMVPGVDIWSTLPNNQYAAWDGTSMAAPIVSGIAALVRTKYADRNSYSSRFIMGQIASTGPMLQAYTPGQDPPVSYRAPRADTALITTATPNLAYLQHWAFDPTSLSPNNDNDGVVESGETIDLGIAVRNHWGNATQVIVTLEARAEGTNLPDPYVTMLISTVDYGSVGSFNSDDNGLIYNAQGAIIGVQNPFRFSLDPGTPNNHIIPFLLTITARNGLDPGDPAVYTFESRFNVTVQRGVQVSGEITQDTTWTADKFYIVAANTLVATGVTLTIEPGTKIVFADATTLAVRGNLVAVGTRNQRITFTSNSLNPQPGIWTGIKLFETAQVNFSYCDISYASTGINPAAGGAGTSMAVSNCQITDAVYGMRIISYTDHTVNVTHNKFLNCTIAGILETEFYVGSFTITNNLFNSTNCVSCVAILIGANNPVPYQISGNAFLDSGFDIYIQDTADTRVYNLTSNYWGTIDPLAISAKIFDYYDDFARARVNYQPFLTQASSEAPAVVANVTTNPSAPLGVGPATFTVTFSTDMDTTVNPLVAFGPAPPYSDYTITGSWVNARTWQGTFNVTPLTGDGIQTVFVANAFGLVDGMSVTNTTSYRFEIITSGTASLNLQATGGEGRVDLMWTQDDFDLLAGFNLYRATSTNGTFSRINNGLIPASQHSYTDTAVQPGQPYYYKFTVVRTDLTESNYSNIASATPLDTIPPVISHTPITSAQPGLSMTIPADVTDNVSVQAVNLFFRAIGAATYTSRPMILTTGNHYSATLEGSLVNAPGLEYYIQATDGVSTVRHGLPENPHSVAVLDRPVVTTVTPNHGPAAGGTAVTIAGSNFHNGATVAFGGAAASNVIVVNINQITCTTPSHFAAAVDVVVTNPVSQTGTMLSAFTYESDVASLSLPSASGEQGAVVQIPINAANVQGLASADVTVTFNTAVVTALTAHTGTLTPGWSIVVNATTPGQVRVSMASPGGTVTGAGILANLEFNVIGNPGTSSVLHISSISLNGGAIPTQTTDGSFMVNLVYSISGAARYWNGAAGVAGVLFSLTGDRVYSGTSNPSGMYAVGGVQAGNYTLTPGKSDGVNGISAFDASMVLQHAAGLITLSGYAASAADVDKSGAINSLDAFYILQNSVGLLAVPFPGAGRVWEFNPSSRPYVALSSNQVNQDFTAALLGDVSGDWSAAGGSGSPATQQATISLPDATVRSGDQITLLVALDLDQAQVYSLDLRINYDPSVMSMLAVDNGNMVSDWMQAKNLTVPGELRVSIAGSRPVTLSGELLRITVQAAGANGSSTSLTVGQGSLNEGNITSALQSGRLTVAQPTSAPMVTNINPTSGSANGGTAVMIKGVNFQAGATVSVGGTAAISVTVIDPNTVTATTQSHSVGVADVVVTNPTAQIGTLIRGYAYSNGSLCPYTLSPTIASHGASAATGSVSVSSPASCDWSASTSVQWIAITSGASGSGNGTVNYSVAANTGPARIGTMAVAGQTFTVTQDSGCAFTLDQDHESFAGNGGTGTVNITASNAACARTASTTSTFITITSGDSGTGDGVVQYTVAANAGSTIRSDTITIGGHTFTVYQGINFLDVPSNHPFYDEIGKLSARGVTLGCGNGNYCPNASVTREQMAAFILRANGEFDPPTPSSQRFNDVPPANVFYNFIDRLAELQITLGCTPDHLMYCPSDPVKREQMAAFLLRGLGEFDPPTPPSQRFSDVPPGNVFYSFIDRLAVLQITLGCTPDHLMYCPNDSVTRAQMAAFLVRAFNL